MTALDNQQLTAAWKAHDQAAAAMSTGPGQVFTPRALALRLARATLQPLQEAPRLLDPACGCGALLLGAIEWAFEHRPQWLASWIQGGLSGSDIDPACVAGCKQSVSLALGPQAAQSILLRDSLHLPAQPGWDVVLANPPWVSFSGRHAVKLGRQSRDFLAEQFVAFRGWPALHAAFCQQAAALTQPNGRFGLLLPLQVADLPAYAAARRMLQARHQLESLTDLGEAAFAGVTEPAGMFVFAPATGPAAMAQWLTEQDHQVLQWAGRIAPLPPAAFGDIGIHSGNAARIMFSTTCAPGQLPVRQGRDVNAFSLAPAALWLKDGPLPPGSYGRIPEPGVFQRARILLRQTADRPIAARHEPVAAFRNSVLACFGAPGHDDDYLLGVLNSALMARIHQALHRDARQRSFPQLKVGHLRALPVPGREIGPLYDAIASAARDCQTARPGARDQLEQLVQSAYASVGAS